MKQEMLQHSYITVKTDSGRLSYGGDQSWLGTEAERSFGCGLIAAADILRYLREKEGIGGKPEKDGREAHLSKETYLEELRELSEVFRIRGALGITGFGLARRMRRIFRKEGLPYRVKWSIGRRHLERRLPEMLAKDIPVLLSVGPGFFHKKARLPLYRPDEQGGYKKTASMRDHYVTVTGRREEKDGWMWRISSWGEEYYVNQEEYLRYVKENDNFLFSSILYIRPAG